MVLECRVQYTGPKPTIEWFKDGEKVQEDERRKMTLLPDGKVTLKHFAIHQYRHGTIGY